MSILPTPTLNSAFFPAFLAPRPRSWSVACGRRSRCRCAAGAPLSFINVDHQPPDTVRSPAYTSHLPQPGEKPWPWCAMMRCVANFCTRSLHCTPTGDGLDRHAHHHSLALPVPPSFTTDRASFRPAVAALLISLVFFLVVGVRQRACSLHDAHIRRLHYL